MESERINISWSLYHLKKLFRCSDKHPALLQNLLVFSFINYVFYNLAYVGEHPISLFIQKICRWCVIPHDHQNVMMMMNFFCGMVNRSKAFSLISSQSHCQRSSPLRISDTPRVQKRKLNANVSLYDLNAHWTLGRNKLGRKSIDKQYYSISRGSIALLIVSNKKNFKKQLHYIIEERLLNFLSKKKNNWLPCGKPFQYWYSCVIIYDNWTVLCLHPWSCIGLDFRNCSMLLFFSISSLADASGLNIMVLIWLDHSLLGNKLWSSTLSLLLWS